ncbi:MAG: lytic murein transglycosylase B [Marinagarivorans sp.]|nr:lytic murein transglycosylase B [Marinagarivorans sp.]
MRHLLKLLTRAVLPLSAAFSLSACVAQAKVAPTATAPVQAASARVDYSKHPAAAAFIKKMVEQHGFDKQYIVDTLAQAEQQPRILELIAKPAEKAKPWYEYRQIFLTPLRVQGGVEFWQQHKDILAEMEKTYGVPAEIIVAIIGVETRYGTYMGTYRVIDALTTLGFDYPPRGAFFAGQLEAFFLMAREQQHDPLSLMGSYAGAMGYGQFIPSSYRSFAVDYDKDGFADIWANKQDAIASVANYFKAHGWQMGLPVAERASRQAGFPENKLNTEQRPSVMANELARQGFAPLSRRAIQPIAAVALSYEGEQGQEYWLGYNNFYVITRYNRSRMYALAVYLLSEEIANTYQRRYCQCVSATSCGAPSHGSFAITNLYSLL